MMLEGEKYELGDSPSHREGIRPDIVSPNAPSEQGRWVDRMGLGHLKLKRHKTEMFAN